jgi:hypothetical protein
MIKKAYDTLMASSVNPNIKECATKAYNNVKVSRNDRMRVTAGRAGCRIDHFAKTIINPYIEWNSTLFARMNEAEQYNTASHEFAHIVDFYCRQKSNHDYFWEHIHRACGGTGERTHKYNVEGLRKNIRRMIVVDKITNREYKITVNNWNRIQWEGRYTLVKTEVYNGKTLVACHNHT